MRVLQLSRDRELISFCNLRKGVKKNLNLSCTEVKWNPELQNTIASAATNGTIMIWDLRSAGISRKVCDFKCKRAPYTLAWSFIDPNVLLSGSTSRVQQWDTRTKKSVSVYKHNRSRSVHNVAFQPSVSHNQFIAGLENGSIVFWDCRYPSKPEYVYSRIYHLCVSLIIISDLSTESHSQFLTTRIFEIQIHMEECTPRHRHFAFLASKPEERLRKWRS